MKQNRIDQLTKREKTRAVIHKILVPLLIATAALGMSIVLIQFAGGYYAKMMQREKPQIRVAEDGTLYVDIKGEQPDLYILWEVDGGNLRAVEESEAFKEQFSEENLGYHVYTEGYDHVIWSPEDADGNRYVTANVVATVYYKTDGKSNYYMESENLSTMLTKTVSWKDGKTVIEDTMRYYSNPVREGGDASWSQIYMVKNEADKVIFRYRFGGDISGYSPSVISQAKIFFEASDEVMFIPDYFAGLYPESTVAEREGSAKLENMQAVTLYKKDAPNRSIRAYMMIKGQKQFEAQLTFDEKGVDK